MTIKVNNQSKFLLKKKFKRGCVDESIFINKIEHDILLVQIYVNDITFNVTNESLCKEFSEIMQNEFEMSMMGKLKYFLGLQIYQTKGGKFINQAKYYKELLKRFDIKKSKLLATTMSTSC